MANIELPPGGQVKEHPGNRWIEPAYPRCAGCGAVFDPGTHPALKARSVEWYSAEFRSFGTKAREVAAFAAAHKACPSPREEILASGIRCVDRRKTDG